MPVSTVAIAVIVIVVALLLVGMLYARNYVKVPANKVAVFTGRGKHKVVRGGARFRMPVVERVDFMELTPFNIQVPVENAFAKDGVAIAVSVVALVRFGSSEELLATAIERWLNADRRELQSQLNEIIGGNMRAICATMTVEELNGNRDQLTRAVKDEAGSALSNIGMEVDVLTIQNITDKNGYLDSLGRKRVAEVKRDAEIGEAEANRDARIRSAQAEQEGRVAEAAAQQQIAEAQRALAIKQAGVDAEVKAAQARAAQAGPQAEAEAQKAVVLAQVAVERERTEAEIAVEEQRALRAQKAQEADVIVPAEAQRRAAVLQAEGERDAAIAAAEAAAKQRKLQGEADAAARKITAEAAQAELEAQANGEKARLLAEAEGQAKMAEALGAYDEESARLRVLPDFIAMLPQVAKAVAEGVKIDHMVVMDGSGNNGNGSALTRASAALPSTLFQLNESLKALGFDPAGFLGSFLDNGQHADGKVPLPAQPTIDEVPAS